jgi:carbon storage regulator CsrA
MIHRRSLKQGDWVMLVLSRKAAQQIVLTSGGETITVEILKITGNRVQIGIAAPTSVAIRRSEIAATEYQRARKTRIVSVA